MKKSIYDLILNYASPLCQEVEHNKDTDSLISEKFQISMDKEFISIWTAEGNIYTIGSSINDLKNPKGALKIVDLEDLNAVVSSPAEMFDFVKILLPA